MSAPRSVGALPRSFGSNADPLWHTEVSQAVRSMSATDAKMAAAAADESVRSCELSCLHAGLYRDLAKSTFVMQAHGTRV